MDIRQVSDDFFILEVNVWDMVRTGTWDSGIQCKEKMSGR